MDITAALASIADAETAVVAIGSAVFAVIVAAALFRWVRRAL